MDHDSLVRYLFSGLISIGICCTALCQTTSDSEETEPTRIDGPAVWQEYARRTREYLVAEEPLRAQYNLNDKPRAILRLFFEEQNFSALDDALAAEFAQIADPMEAEEYDGIVQNLAQLSYRYEPEDMRSIARQWTEKQPDSHFAWLVRGLQSLEYAWYWRGGGMGSTVTQKGWWNFEEAGREARKCLEQSYTLNPKDPAVLAGFLQYAVGGNLKRGEFDRYFREACAISPSYLSAYGAKRRYLSPWWYGSWEQIDAFEREVERKTTELNNPMLLRERYLALVEMSQRREDRRGMFQAAEVLDEIQRIHRDIVERWPDSDVARANLAYVAMLCGKPDEAVEQFDRLENRFPLLSDWPSLTDYHKARASAYGAVNKPVPVGDTQ